MFPCMVVISENRVSVGKGDTMYCNYCGTNLPEDAKFCHKCGKAIPVAPVEGRPVVEPPAVPEEVLPVIEQPVAPEPKKQTISFKKPSFSRKKIALDRKKLALGALALLGVVVVVLIAVTAVRNYRKTVILGQIPDPEAFFGISATPTWELEDMYLKLRFDGDDLTPEMLDAYAELLNSSDYPFAQRSKEEDRKDYGFQRHLDRSYEFSYTGEKDPYYDYGWQMVVKYSWLEFDHRYITVIIKSPNNFERVPVEPYAAAEELPAAAERPAIEDLEIGVAEPAPVTAQLPDPTAYFGVEPVWDKTYEASDGAWWCWYKMDLDKGWSAGHDFVQVLSDSAYGLVMRERSEEDTWTTWTGQQHDVYFFDYVGEADIDPIQGEYSINGKGIQQYTADVFVHVEWINGPTGKEHAGMVLSYSSDFERVDPGVRATDAGSLTYVEREIEDDDDDRGSSFDDDECSACNGSGKCSFCNGSDKTKRFQAGLGWVEQNCTFCSMGQCPYCHGRG